MEKDLQTARRHGLGAALKPVSPLATKNRAARVQLAFWLFCAAFLAHAPALLGVFPGALPSTGDTFGQFAPWHEFVRLTLAEHGAVPLWNPHIYGGMPFGANGQSALFYPPTWLHFLLPENLALWVFAFLHTFFFMLGGYFLARTLGISRRAALLVALLLGWGNATPAHLFGGHLTFLPARAFWPWQAAFLIRLLRGDNSRFEARNAIALAACLSLGLSAGAPQIWLFGVWFCAAITVFWMLRAAQNRQALSRWSWKAAGLALCLTVLWCAPVLLPLRELKDWSSRGEMLSFADVSDLSATPRSLFRLLFNNFFGGNSFSMWSLPSNPGEDGASIGLAGCLLALAAPFLATRNHLARALWLGCALTLWLALGSATPLYRALYDNFLLFQITRVPARWLELWAFGAALLAGIGFDCALKNPARWRRLLPFWTVGALGCIALGAAVWLSQSPWQRGAQIVMRALDLSPDKQSSLALQLQSEALLSVALGFLALGALVVLGRRNRTGIASNRIFALILMALCAEPLANFWLSVRISSPELVSAAQLPAPLALRHQSGERWIVRAPFQQLNAPLAARIDALNGYEPFGSAPFFHFAKVAQPGARFSADFQPETMDPLWRVMGVSHLLWKPKFDGDGPRGFAGKTIARSGEWRLNSIEDGLKPWPRVYLTTDIHRAASPEALQALEHLAARPFEGAPPATISPDFPALFTSPLTSPFEPEKGGIYSIESQFQSANGSMWQIPPRKATLWVQNEVMAPGWKAFVDGKSTKIYLANGIFRGVYLPAQSRQIALVFDSQTLRFALFLSLCGLGAGAFCLVSRRAGITKLRE